MDEPTFLHSVLRLFAALLFVLGLMGGLAFVLRRLQSRWMPGLMPTQSKHLQVTESLTIGPRHRAVLLRRDERMHLVILGPTSETVVESFIHSAGQHDTQKL
ncbi:MAG: flagellar biosynthetic protein FliO [Alphaproteobacteria bacterium]|nr:flagellar biosynthetic protein FliO [Alphaproteobacteria bacterium]